MRISHAIYRVLYVQSRGELRRRLTRHCAPAVSAVRATGRWSGAGGFRTWSLSLSVRPRSPTAPPRGHWEGDLLLGANGRSCIATLVERHVRYVMLAGLGQDRTTARHRGAQDADPDAPDPPGPLAHLGSGHRSRRAQDVHRPDRSRGLLLRSALPWQGGSNENTNRLLRQYIPKGTDLAAISQSGLHEIACQINARPRKTLDDPG